MKNKKEVVEEYRKQEIADNFDKERDAFEYMRYKHKIESSIIADAIKESKKNKLKVLDVACGTGRMLGTVFSDNRYIEYFGLDSSEAMLKHLKEKAKNLGREVNLIVSYADDMPFEDESFDVVFSYHLLWHLQKEEQEKIILDMLRVTKKGGVVIFDILNKNFIWEKLKTVFGIKKTEGIHKLKISEARKITKKDLQIEKLFDIPIKNNLLYNVFNLINHLRRIIPTYFFHMLFIKIKK